MRNPCQSALAPLFAPASVAIVGATDEPDRASGRLVRHLTEYGYAGRLYLVNPRRSEVAGRPCYRALDQLPEQVDLALYSIAAERVPEAIRDAGRAGVKAAVVFASGFAEDVESGGALQDRLLEAWRPAGVRLLGPNTAGFRATHLGLFAEQGTTLDIDGFRAGSVAMISQSGALGAYFGSTYLQDLGVGTRYFVDTGNELDVDAADCLAYVGADPAVSCIGLVLESCRDGRRLADAVRRATEARRPVVFLKVGRSDAGMKAALTHTAAMASQAELLEAELAAAGAFVTRDERQLADALMVHATGSAPAGRRLGIVTPSGGFGILALDLAGEVGLAVPPLAPNDGAVLSDTVRLRELRNPLEIPVHLSQPGTEALEGCLTQMGTQSNVDAVVLWHPHRFVSLAEQEAHLPVFRRVRDRIGKPILHCGMTSPEYRRTLQGVGVLSFETPTRLMRAIAATAPPSLHDGKRRSEAVLRPATPAPSGEHEPLSAADARALLSTWGLPFTPTEVVSSPEQVADLERDWGRPIVLKLESRRATHKTEKGFVRGPHVGPELMRAFDDLSQACRSLRDPEARIVAQPFERGIELALGVFADPSFGPCVMVAHGGIFAETLDDAAFAAAPIDAGRAEELIASLRLSPALSGSRGRPADVPTVARALASLSRFAAAPENTGITVDVNPLIVRELGAGVVAVDARVVRPSGTKPT